MAKNMNIQRLRNLTTGRLHTSMKDICQDLEWLTGISPLYTHQLPAVMDSVKPWLGRHVLDSRLWDGDYDPHHTGEISLPTPTEAERAAMRKRLQ